VLEGVIKGRVNQKKTEVPAGEFFFVNSGELHETDANDRNQMYSITILLSYNLLKEYCSNIDSYYFDFSGNIDAQNKVKNLIIECADLYEKKEEFYELEISIVLRKICSVLLKQCKKKREGVNYNRYEQKSMINIKKAIAYMEKHYENDVSLQSIAEEVRMTPTYFSRFFKKTTGETFYCYLNKIRLYYAHKELINSDASMTEIALNNGFSNVKSFIESFKKVYKSTPAKYKKKLDV
jgi:AraC-like DNA-binding protein